MFLYGNCKIHKNIYDPPLRPIISQIPAPTNDIAKFLNNIIEPYHQVKYSIKSTEELLELLKVTQPTGILASLDVESLFTNVPINDTISIILNSVYRHPYIPPPNLPKETLKKLLEICTN